MGIKICGAPCCWGVMGDFSSPEIPDWKKVLQQAHEAGYRAIELGPNGWIPFDIEEVSRTLEEYDMAIVAGTIFDNCISEEVYPRLLKETEEICKMLSALPKLPSEPGQKQPAPYLTMMDFGSNEARNYDAGHGERARRLDDSTWEKLMEHFKGLCEIAHKYQIRPVIHHHCGGYVEFGDEIDRLAESIPYSEAGLLLDVGHLAYAGLEPSEWLIKYQDRLDYVHFKDINQRVYNKVLRERMGFFDACEIGATCPIGQGSIDYRKINQTLKDIHYNGYITIEQEYYGNPAQSVNLVRESIQYLKDTGYEV